MSAIGTKRTSPSALHMSAFGGIADVRLAACVEALPPDQAAPLWQTAQTQAAAHLG
jgi:hypothetical protein